MIETTMRKIIVDIYSIRDLFGTVRAKKTMSFVNCWYKRTPFETIMILILIIAVPFLIGMVLVYTLIPLFGERFVHCPTFCDDYTVTVSKAKPKSGNNMGIYTRKGVESCDSELCETVYSFLVALLAYRYDDDLSEKVYIGAGVLVTRKWALTSGSIVEKYMYDLPKIKVRAGSSYWSKGGVVSSVARIMLADESERETLAAVYLTAIFPSSVTPVKISSKTSYTNNVVYPSYGWNANYSLALRLRRKYISSVQIYVTAFDTDVCPEITQGRKFCGRPLHSPTYQPCFHEVGLAMVDQDNALLGIKSGEICRKSQSVHIYLNVAMYIDWIRNVTRP